MLLWVFANPALDMEVSTALFLSMCTHCAAAPSLLSSHNTFNATPPWKRLEGPNVAGQGADLDA